MKVTLVANLGAEEGGDFLHDPALRDPIRCFSWLFGPEVSIVGWEDTPPWPPSLGAPPSGPAFPWIEGEGFSWLVSEEAVSTLRQQGAWEPGSAPEPSIVREVNDKAFAQRVAEAHGLVPPCLRGLIHPWEPEEVEEARVAEAIEALPPWVGGKWMLKPRLGTSGRGRVRDLSHVSGSRPRFGRRGGAVFEPWLRRREDLSALLHVGQDGTIHWVGTTRQIVRGTGVYGGNTGVVEEGAFSSGTVWEEDLRHAATILGEEAARQGYFGPLGLDAFVFDGPSGEPVLRPVVEINARFTMGFVAVGLARRAIAAGSMPATCAWLFSLRSRPKGDNVLPLGDGACLVWGEDREAVEATLSM